MQHTYFGYDFIKAPFEINKFAHLICKHKISTNVTVIIII